MPKRTNEGKDYKIDEVIGKDYIIANGGRVLLISFLEGFSTTKKIKKSIDKCILSLVLQASLGITFQVL